MKTLLLIRHGQASAGTHDYDRLSALGEQQAAVVGQNLRQRQPAPVEFWSGTLKRQRDTARIAVEYLATQPEIGEHAGLNEYDHRPIHAWYHPLNRDHTDHIDLPTDMTLATYRQIIAAWRDDTADPLPDHLEPWQLFTERTTRAVLDICTRSSSPCIALFSSGGVIATLISRWQQGHHDDVADAIWRMANASITEVHFSDGHFGVHLVNDFSHLGEKETDPLVTWI